MPVVTTTFSTTLSDVWASPTWAAGDPSKKVHDQLSAWVNAINDPTKIALIHGPGDATARGSTDVVQWLLRAREAETTSDYGIRFMPRRAGAADSSGNVTGIYFGRTAGSDFNGAGTMSVHGNTTMQMPTLSSVVLNMHVAYRADGDLPWFLCAFRYVAGATSYGHLHLLARVSTSDIAAGSYYPGSGLGKWIYAMMPDSAFSTSNQPNIYTPQSGITAPYKGVTNFSTYLRYPTPAATAGDGYFFRFGAQYGVSHYLGAPNYDDFLVSNTATGTWADTVVINSVTYIRVGPIGLWVRSS